MVKELRKDKSIEVVEEVDRLTEKHTRDIKSRIRDLFKRQPEQKIADTLNADPEHRLIIFNSLNRQQKEQALDLVTPHTLRSIISHLSDKEVVKLIERAPSLVGQKVINATERSRIHRLIPLIFDEHRRQSLIHYVNYAKRSVGRIMQPEVLIVKESNTILQALRSIATFDTSNGPIYQIYIVDDSNKLKGTIPISDVVQQPGKTAIGELHLRKPPTIRVNTSQEKAAQLFSEYDLIEAPVMSDGSIVGRLLVDDILDVIQQEFTEDVQKFAGITSEETLDTPPVQSSMRRLPWMIANIFLALTAVSVISFFEAEIATVTALAVLMPVISNMGGNVGIQSLTVSIRALADNKPRWRLVTRELNKELQVGAMNGIILGSILGIVGLIVWDSSNLGIVAMLAIFFNTILASMIGGILPILLTKLKKDPALMSGAILTTISDFSGFLIFLVLAKALLPQI